MLKIFYSLQIMDFLCFDAIRATVWWVYLIIIKSMFIWGELLIYTKYINNLFFTAPKKSLSFLKSFEISFNLLKKLFSDFKNIN